MHNCCWQDVTDTVAIYTDADWAVHKESRKSTTGGCILHGKHLLKIWAKIPALIALSSEESEFYAAIKASAEGLGMRSVAEDLGFQ